MTEAPNLSSCPFCGALPDIAIVLCGVVVADERAFYAKCPDCRVETPTYPTEAEAIAAWNRRAADPEGEALTAVVKLARDFIEEEADNRGAAGSEMSDYEREPRELLDRIDAALSVPAEESELVQKMHELASLDHAQTLRAALEWIEAFAQIRAKDDSKTFARVNRGALRTIAEKAGAALASSPPESSSRPIPERIARELAYADRHGLSDDLSLGTSSITYGELRALIAAAEARSEQVGWQLIETAPKDGIDILGGYTTGGMLVVCWDAAAGSAGGWISGTTDNDGDLYTYPVTHWQPLPTPPKAEADHG